MSIDAEPIVVTLRVAAELERLDVEYFVGGSLASSVPRTTQDVGLAVQGDRFYLEYARRWTEVLALTDLLARAVSDAGATGLSG